MMVAMMVADIQADAHTHAASTSIIVNCAKDDGRCQMTPVEERDRTTTSTKYEYNSEGSCEIGIFAGESRLFYRRIRCH